MNCDFSRVVLKNTNFSYYHRNYRSNCLLINVVLHQQIVNFARWFNRRLRDDLELTEKKKKQKERMNKIFPDQNQKQFDGGE